MATSSIENHVDEQERDSAPGPLGCKYDDSLTELHIQLVVPGIREKSFMKASNTQVFLKSDCTSLSCHIEIIKVNKKVKPPMKTVIDRRFYENNDKLGIDHSRNCLLYYVLEVEKFPGEISDVSFRLKKNCCILIIRKKVPQSWANFMSQSGF